MSTVVKDLGAVSAYAYAVEKGYTGTEAEFAELMASYADVGQTAVDAKDAAVAAKTAAQTAATTATNKASEATTAAQTATTKAGEASQSASQASTSAQTASTKASEASQSASKATEKATEATTAASNATTAKYDAVTAKNAAQTARDKAETAQGKAEDAAESVSASAAQIAQNTSDITDLKSDLSDITTTISSINLYNPNDPYVLTDKYLNSNGTLETVSQRTVSGFIPVTPGQQVVFSQNSVTRLFSATCFYGSDKTTVISGGVYNEHSVTVPEGAAYVRVTFPSIFQNPQIECNADGTFSPYEPYRNGAYLILDDTFLSDKYPASAMHTLAKIQENMHAIVNTITSRNVYNPDDPDVLTDKYINPDGMVETYEGRTVTGYMNVIPGLKVVLSRFNGAVQEEDGWSSLCFYDATKAVVSGGAYNTNKLSVPANAAYARVTFSPTYYGLQIECNAEGQMTPYEPYFAAYDTLNAGIKVDVKSIRNAGNLKNMPDAFRWRGDLSSGDIIKLPVTNVKNQQVYSFSGEISNFSKVLIGRVLSDDSKYGAFEIDATNIKFYCDNGNTETIVHGLTITNNIQIEIATTNTYNLAKMVLTSNGVKFNVFANLTNKRFLGDEGAPFVQSDGSSLTDCSFAWTSRSICKPIWMFGDSYMSLYDVRWVYYLIQDGYDKSCLINAYAGEASAAALASLRNLLTLQSRPRYILWALGMNDGDTGGVVNTSWKNCYDAVVSLCEENGIIPIFATIPNTPSIDNTYKNAIIKASGYRYIDFAASVGASDANSPWYSGMLNSDNVHPNATGAIALYYQALSDFPELVTE